ncbi:PREDICTED: uncharacterized protein LOC109337183 isoform X1 [Lupinus angustifolius]|nr:PREDICTED: uncharacterized protein LOC109337183 isoform X1 [Lupinus angustifolius]
MEFPFNHNHHHDSNVTHTDHHNRRNDNEETLNYPPPPTEVYHTGHVSHGHVSQDFNNSTPLPYPPPPDPYQQETQVFHTGHVAHGHVSQDFNHFVPPQPYNQVDDSVNYGYPPPGTTNVSVQHVSHETRYPVSDAAAVQHVGHQSGVVGLSNKTTVRVVTKAAPNYSLTIRHGKVILAPSDPRDEYQHWYKDEKYSTRVKDSEGSPAFSLVNKATGEAIKHSIGATHPVHLVPYNPNFLDESVLWTESRDMGDGHRTVRMVNNIRLNLDAFHGDKNSGGVHEGTTVVLWEWNKGDNQLWKILPY